MSRSIHDTWGVRARARLDDWSDDGLADAIVKETSENLRRLASFRYGQRRRRREGPARPPPFDPASVSIIVDELRPPAFHAVTEEDVRTVLARLPPGSLDGLAVVRLCMGGGPMREIVLGVEAGRILGKYNRRSATICIHAFSCAPGALGPLTIWLKLRTLGTLLHEAAHHFDFTFRGGRTRYHPRAKSEAFAERGERAIGTAAAYLRERYPEECAAFEDWFAARAGHRLPRLLEIVEHPVIGFPRELRELAVAPELDEARLILARARHHIGDNETAIAIVDALLARDASHPRALALRACIASCGARDHERAARDCEQALARDPQCIDAWESLARSWATAERWDDASAAAERGLALLPDGDERGDYFLRVLLERHMLRGTAAEVRAMVDRVRAWREDLQPNADVHALVDLCWREQWQDAYVGAARCLAIARYAPWRDWLRGVRFESAVHLGRDPGALDDAAIASLADPRFTAAWAARLGNARSRWLGRAP